MSDQRRIIALNNHGVRLLQQQNHLQANHTLLQSLKNLKQTLKRQRLPGAFEKLPHLVEADDDDSDSSSSEEDRPSCFTAVPLQRMTTASTSHNAAATETEVQLLDRLFCFTPNHNPTSEVNRDGSAAAILYNLAMAQHLGALTLPLTSHAKAKAAMVSKALRMYTWALTAMQHWARHATSMHNGCHLLRLAILNNMAHAQGLMGETTQQHHSFRCLRDVLHQSKVFLEDQRDVRLFSDNLVVALCNSNSNSHDESTTNSNNCTKRRLLIVVEEAPAAAA